jgi:hypothetical protein
MHRTVNQEVRKAVTLNRKTNDFQGSRRRDIWNIVGTVTLAGNVPVIHRTHAREKGNQKERSGGGEHHGKEHRHRGKGRGRGGLPRNQRHACAQVSDICKIVPVDSNIAAATEVIVSR